MIIGALGRCGLGATELAKKVGFNRLSTTLWDLEATKGGGPFPEILDYDILGWFSFFWFRLGLGVDGVSNTLNLVPESLHARTPFCFGSRDEILCLMKEVNIDK